MTPRQNQTMKSRKSENQGRKRYMPEEKPSIETLEVEHHYSSPELVHAVFVSALRHRRGRNIVRHFDVVDVADQRLSVEAEGFTHQTSDSGQKLV